MARVTRRKVKDPVGYGGKQGSQVPREDKVSRKAAAAFLAGAKFFEDKEFLLVKVGGQFVEWCRADPTKIGR
jgi:hypothetical protein